MLKVVTDKGCKPFKGDRLAPNQEYPFFTSDGQKDIHCVHCDHVTAVTEEVGGEQIGIIGMARKGVGMIAGYKSDRLRDFAKQLNAMADFIDKENAK